MTRINVLAIALGLNFTAAIITFQLRDWVHFALCVVAELLVAFALVRAIDREDAAREAAMERHPAGKALLPRSEFANDDELLRWLNDER